MAHLHLRFPKKPNDYSKTQSSKVNKTGWVKIEAPSKAGLIKYLTSRGIVLGSSVDLAKHK